MYENHRGSCEESREPNENSGNADREKGESDAAYPSEALVELVAELAGKYTPTKKHSSSWKQ